MQLCCLVVEKARRLCTCVTLPYVNGNGLGGGICSTSSSARNLEQHRARLNLAFLPTGESLSKNKSQIEGEIVAEGKRTNKWALQQEDPVLH